MEKRNPQQRKLAHLAPPLWRLCREYSHWAMLVLLHAIHLPYAMTTQFD